MPTPFFMPTLRTVFLDRDGVLNHKLPEDCYVRTPEELRLIDGVPQAIARLNQAGLRVLVVSNQRGVSLGRMTSEDVRRVHDSLQSRLQPVGAHIDRFYFCPHGKNECPCRKPLPGMFHAAQQEFPETEASSSIMIGDSLLDIEFGSRLGMKTIFLPSATGEIRSGTQAATELASACFPSLAEAVDALLGPARSCTA